MKKFLVMALAVVMALSCVSIAFAADAELGDSAAAAEGQQVDGTTTIEVPTIKVTVPTTAEIIINPFQMEVNDAEGNPQTSQIIAAEQQIKNESDVAIAVNVTDAKVTEVGDEDIVMATAALTAKDTAKKVLLYLEVIDDSANDAAFAESYVKAANQVLFPYKPDGDEYAKVKAGAADAIVTLAAGADAATTATFTLGGAVVANPVSEDADDNEVSDPWTDADTLTLSWKFTFTPQVVETTTAP